MLLCNRMPLQCHGVAIMVELCTFLQVFYTFLMYIEFGIGEWLEQRPFLYAITHQVSSLDINVMVTILNLS